jgi:hypothetical protein
MVSTDGERRMKEILQRAAPAIRAWGYRGSGQHYRRLVGDVVFAINFQKSRANERFYLNLGAQPLSIPDVTEGEPNPTKLKEIDCVFRRRLDGEWAVALSEAETDAMIATLAKARAEFESNVAEIRERSRQGRWQELLGGFSLGLTEARSALMMGRLLATDGQRVGARALAEKAIELAGGAHGLRAAAERLAASVADE